MSLRLGILIAGSLYWRTEAYRVEWRSKHLNADASVAVNIPIRYGRLSSSQTYTMVYAPGCPEELGKIMPCARLVSTAAEVIREAKALWVAEQLFGSRPNPQGELSADWGCVALLANPNRDVSRHIFEEWVAKVSGERGRRGLPTYDATHYRVKGRSAIDDHGILQIPWPAVANSEVLDNFDLLLATATRPSPDRATGDYPAVAAIAGAWNKKGDADYFRMNRKFGFRTFQDDAIDALLTV